MKIEKKVVMKLKNMKVGITQIQVNLPTPLSLFENNGFK